MDDERILDLYAVKSETAIVETDKKYGRYCRYIATRILGDDTMAQEVVNDTYLCLFRVLSEKRVLSLKGYIGTVCRNLSLNRYEKEHAQKRLDASAVPLLLDELAECVSDRESDPLDAVALKEALCRFVRALPDRTKAVFIRRYFYASSVGEIAKDYDMKENTVCALLLRARKRLRSFLIKEGFDV